MSEVDGVCLVVCGPPRSGKTSFSTALVNKFASQPYSIFYHEYDLYLGKFDLSTEQGLYRSKRVELLDSIFRDLKRAVGVRKQKIVLLLDDVMYLKSMRHEVYKRCRRENLEFFQIVLKAPLMTTLERFESSPNNLTMAIVKKLHTLFELPKCAQWERNHLIVDSEEYFENFEVIIEKICCLMKSNILPRPDEEVQRFESIVATRNSLIHQADLIIRKTISRKILQHNGLSNLKEFSEKLSFAKKLLLRKLQQNYIVGSDELFSQWKSGKDKISFVQLIESKFNDLFESQFL
ncbi:L-seryl-tRNA(Sec) kinase [Thelohanellus kitauei]|uniref:L-seryl-tRNA(Sec) kinase n=1 Tax=Thelohanellus kitauei TaxID=669202 RepID=A0A0C2IA85_THEKT|nr:L-seryl-tRNA(Sec) kinase [Thelohanellus kitauei]